jgi:serine/threonine protein kinase
MSKFSVLAIGIAMLDALEKIHGCGYTFNDLKPDNIILGYKSDLNENLEQNVFKNTTLHLIDYGFADKYMIDGEHIPISDIETFRGNFLFASVK